MRSREFRVLVRKDLAELFASRAFWLLLLIIGPLVGQSLAQALASYEEASGIGGGPAALAQGLSPLDGIFVPVMGAYDIAIMLLFPFVAIRLLASEKSSDALKLVLQWRVTRSDIVMSKVVTLVVAWLLSLFPFAVAVSIFGAQDGHVFAPELANLFAGYTLRFLFTATLSLAAAAIMPGAANAAIVVLAFTIGTWALDFLSAGRGGFLARLGSYTPTAILRNFERGLLRLDVVLVWLIIAAAFFTIATIWIHLGSPDRTKVRDTIACVIVAILLAIPAASIKGSFDVSENRRNSFGDEDERALSQIHDPLTVTVWLAAEDPRMTDFSNNVLIKLRRALSGVDIRFPLAGKSGLFENNDRYGEIDYQLNDKTATNRSTTEEIVLDTIYEVAGVKPPQRRESEYPGYPLKQHVGGAAIVFYVLWPIGVLTLLALRRSRRTG